MYSYVYVQIYHICCLHTYIRHMFDIYMQKHIEIYRYVIYTVCIYSQSFTFLFHLLISIIHNPQDDTDHPQPSRPSRNPLVVLGVPTRLQGHGSDFQLSWSAAWSCWTSWASFFDSKMGIETSLDVKICVSMYSIKAFIKVSFLNFLW